MTRLINNYKTPRPYVLFRVSTDSANSVAIRCGSGGGDVAKTIEWGDGTESTGAAGATVSHTYAAAGTYDIKIGPGWMPSYQGQPFPYTTAELGPCVAGFRFPSNITNAFYRNSGASDGLTKVLNIDLAGVTNMLNAFVANAAMTEFSAINTSSLINIGAAWGGTKKLTTFPLIDLSNVTSATSAWSGSGIVSFPSVNLAKAQGVSNTWSECPSLTTFPALDLRAVVNAEKAWNNCTALVTFPAVQFAACINFNYTWAGCTKLANFPPNLFDHCPAASFTNAFGQASWNAGPMTAISIENILTSLVTAGHSNGSIHLYGAGESTWTAAAKAAKATLVSRTWTIANNP